MWRKTLLTGRAWALACAWCTLGEQASLVDLQSSPGTAPALYWNIWKTRAPPLHAKDASEPWRQISGSLPRAFFWDPVSNAYLHAQAHVAVRLSLLLEEWGQREGLGRETSERDIGFSETTTWVGTWFPSCWISGWENFKLRYYLQVRLLCTGDPVRVRVGL